MTESWQCDGICGQHFTSIKSRIQLLRRVVSCTGYEDIPYLDLCPSCEWWLKKGGLRR